MKRFIVTVLALFVIGFIAIAGYLATRSDQDIARWLGETLSEQLGRKITISESVRVDWGTSPTILIKGLEIANASWGKNEYLLKLDEGLIQFRIKPLFRRHLTINRIQLLGVALHLEQNSQGKGNWELDGLQPAKDAPAVKSDPCGTIPDIRHFSIANGILSLGDDSTWPDKILIDSFGVNTTEEIQPLVVSFAGTVHQALLNITAEVIRSEQHGGSIRGVTTRLSSDSLSFEADAQLRPTAGKCQIEAKILAEGGDIHGVKSLFPVDLPHLGPYAVSANFKNPVDRLEFDEIRLKMGESDLEGSVHVDTQTKRVAITTTLKSNLLRIQDFAEEAPVEIKEEESDETPEFVFSKEPFPLELLTKVALDSEINVGKLQVDDHWILSNVHLKAKSDEREAHVDLLKATLFDGSIKSKITLSNLHEEPHLRLNAKLDQVELGALTRQSDTLEAKTDLEVQLTSKGRSMRDFAEHSNGAARLVTTKGRFENDILSTLTAGLQDLLSPIFGGADESTLHCIISEFLIENGVAKSEKFLIHASSLGIIGKGHVDLGKEEMKLAFRMKSDRPSLSSLLIPFKVAGRFLKQKVFPDFLGTGKEIIGAPATIASDTAASVGEAVDSIIGKKDPNKLSRLCEQFLKDEIEAEQMLETEPQSEDAQPEDAQPEDAQPEDAQPEDAQPEDAQPEDAQPEDAQPVVPQTEATQEEDSQIQASQPEAPQPDEAVIDQPEPDRAQLPSQ